jgi:hypothetical protein
MFLVDCSEAWEPGGTDGLPEQLLRLPQAADRQVHHRACQREESMLGTRLSLVSSFSYTLCTVCTVHNVILSSQMPNPNHSDSATLQSTQWIINAAHNQRSWQSTPLFTAWYNHQIWGQCMFGAPERLPAFGARTCSTVITTFMVQD